MGMIDILALSSSAATAFLSTYSFAIVVVNSYFKALGMMITNLL